MTMLVMLAIALTIVMVISVLSMRGGPNPRFDRDGHRIGYDPHYTRELEQRVLGYAATKCGRDDCKTCNPPRPARYERCKVCGKDMPYPSREKCRSCTFAALNRPAPGRRPKRPMLTAEHNKTLYGFHVPLEVPDNAHVEITHTDFMDYQNVHAWAHCRWIDKDTGETKFMRVPARMVESHNVYVAEYAKPIATFHPDLKILTERTYK